MPTYQYICTGCNEPLEVVQSFSDDALTECPNCEGRLRKVFSPVGVVFKGSGFYRTDSRSDSRSSAKPAAKSNGASTAKESPSSAPAPSTAGATGNGNSDSGSSASTAATATTAA